MRYYLGRLLNYIVVIRAKFQKDSLFIMDVTGKRDFARSQFNTDFRQAWVGNYIHTFYGM